MVSLTETQKQENRIKIVSQVKWDSSPKFEVLFNHYVTCDTIFGTCESCNQIDKLIKQIDSIYKYHSLGQD